MECRATSDGDEEECHGEACGNRDGRSSGIGLGIARVLGEEGYALTVAARRPEKLEEAVQGLRAEGHEVNSVSGKC